MKCSIAINLVTLGMSSIMAQPPAPSAAEEAEWVKIRNIKAIYEDAVNTYPLEKLKTYVAKNLHGVMVNGREARSYDDLVKIVADLRALIGDGGSYHVKVNYEPGTMFGDLAVANGTAEESIVTGSGRRFETTSTWLVNLIKEDGDWKLYRVQATMDPVNNVFVRDTVKYASILFGGGGVLVGAILGAVTIRLFRR
jgi:hypothetical protein